MSRPLLTALNRAPILSAYAAIAVLASVALARNLWSAPDAPWQTSLAFLEDIDHLLSGRLGQVTWFSLTSGHALSGYRLFEYFSSFAFGLNTQVELWMYWIIVAFLSAIGFRTAVKKHGLPASKLGLMVLVAMALIPLSFSGSGSRGMELGTYTGVLLAVISFQYFSSNDSPSLLFIILTILFFVFLFFFFLGGYGAGVALGYAGLVAINIKASPRLISKRLVVAAMASSFSLVAYFLAVRFVDASATGIGPSLLAEQIAKDPLYVAKFLLAAPASGLTSTQTFEIFGGFLLEIFALSFGFVILLGFSLILKKLLKDSDAIPSFPFFLIFYALGTAIMLLFYRPYETYQLINGWYSLHFKLLLVGLLFLFYVFLQKPGNSLPLRRLVFFNTSLMLIVFMCANILQIRRQDSERVYFQNVAKVALFPQLLERDPSGFSQLVIPFESSSRALQILQRNRLSVFNNPQKSLEQLSSANGLIFLGDYWPDGWIGRNIEVVSINSNCLDLEVDITPFAPAQNTGIEIGGVSKPLSKVGASKFPITVPEYQTGNELTIGFKNSKSPADAGINGDTRELAASIKTTCLTSN
jgi:hypothetical protein